MELEKYIVATDQELISKATEGDSVAFEHLFNRYRDAIRQIYLQRTGGRGEDADDLLQETFIKVYLNLDRYDEKYTFGQWIYTIARNTFVDFMRKRRGDLSIDTIPSGPGAIVPPAASPTPEESFIHSQQQAQLEHHMARMTPRYRRLIELRFLREYSYEEISAELDLPMGTVKTQIHRAREQLCRFITEQSDILA
jgi:RNA polymerase sigma-70 factor (ECF subfamily)